MTETLLRNPNNLSRIFKRSEIASAVGGYSFLYILFFSPVIFGGRLLAFSDTVLAYLPSFLVGIRLWDPLVLSGFPTAADPQSMYWYPLTWIFSWIDSWNGFVVIAYILSSCFMHGYMLSITKSRLAAAVSGISYGMCAFLVAHLGHTTLIHAGPWIILWVWSVEKLSAGALRLWFLSGTLAITFCLLSGHPQMFIYLMIVGGIYVAVRAWRSGLRFLLLCAGMVIAGVGLAAIQIFPFAELAAMSHRARTGFQEYVSYSLPPRQLLCLFFPFLYGGTDPKFFPWYAGSSIFVELACYLGFLPVMLGITGLLRWRDRPLTWLWFGLAIFALLQMLGAATPLASLFYHLPVLNKLRAPARYTFILSMSFSVLAGLGVAVIQQHIATRKTVLQILLSSLFAMIIATAGIYVFSSAFPALSNSTPFSVASHPLARPATILPWIFFTLSCISLFLWSRNASSSTRKAFLVLSLVLDLGVFGWLVEWRPHSVSKKFIEAPPIAKEFSGILRREQARMIPIRGGSVERNDLPPNLSRLWNVPSASGYGPLLLWRYGKMLDIYTSGVLDPEWSDLKNRALDLLSVRYVFVPDSIVTMTHKAQTGNIEWPVSDLTVTLGLKYVKAPTEMVKLELIHPVTATSIGLVTNLSWSGNVYDNEEVMEVEILDTAGKTHSIPIRAGQDTSEWAYDCTPEGFYHSKARIFESVRLLKKNCEGHRYYSIKKIGGRFTIKEIGLRLVSTANVNVHKVALYDETQNSSFPVSEEGSDLSQEKRWRHIKEVGAVDIYENLRAMPRAWLVPRVVSLNEEEILKTIHSSKFSDGANFHPAKVAMVEEPLRLLSKIDGKAAVNVNEYTNRVVAVSTKSRFDSFLVLSEVYYPGWQVKIDGKPAHLYRTNFILRGVAIPAGLHQIRFEYRPRSFYLGTAVSLCTILLLITGLLLPNRFGLARKM